MQQVEDQDGVVLRLPFTEQWCSRTLPWHPVPMLRKLTEDHGQWPRQLKFCLYAVWAKPHRDTGFSPFEVVYGRNLHTPLELLYDSWLEPDCVSVNLTSWMEKFNTRVRTVRECLRVTELKARERVRQETVKLRTFKAGVLV